MTVLPSIYLKLKGVLSSGGNRRGDVGREEYLTICCELPVSFG